jgi:hypothetical protein
MFPMSAHEAQKHMHILFCLICASVQLRYHMAERAPPGDAWHGDGSTSIPLTHNSIPRPPYNLTRRGGNLGTWRPWQAVWVWHGWWLLTVLGFWLAALSVLSACPWKAAWPVGPMLAGAQEGRHAAPGGLAPRAEWSQPQPASHVMSWLHEGLGGHMFIKKHVLVMEARTAIRRGRICTRK